MSDYDDMGDIEMIDAENDIEAALRRQDDAMMLLERLRLSARGFTRVLRVARTVADLAGAALVRRGDVAEALAYRHRIPGRSA